VVRYWLFGKNMVEERVPGKQGLKLESACAPVDLISRRRASSRKTRIETNLGILNVTFVQGRRASSRKTRIETPSEEVLKRFFNAVEERVPGKQGLKLTIAQIAQRPERKVEERVPGKQGLKPNSQLEVHPSRLESKSEFQENKD